MRLSQHDLDELDRTYRSSVADLRALQDRVLRAILDCAGASAFVRERGLAGASVDELRERVPIQTYEDHAPYINRMMAGEPDQLFDGSTTTFFHTSGTTAGPKLFPDRQLSADQKALERIDNDFETSQFLRRDPGVSFRGKQITDDVGLWLPIVGSPIDVDASGRKIGFISGHTYEQLYRAAPQYFFTRPSWLRHLHGDHKLYVLARLAVSEDIRVVNGLPYVLGELASVLSAATEQLVRDVRDGTLSGDVPAELAAELPPLRPDPERARAIEKLAARDGGVFPRHLWPRLALVRTMSQASMRLYGEYLETLFGAPIRDMGLQSTEGRVIAYLTSAGLVPAVHRHVFELVDEDERSWLLHEAERGKTYRLVLTTPHGLFRYDTRDMVQVIDHQHGVPIIELRGRAGAIDLAGEKVTDAHVTEALAAALASVQARMVGFSVVPHPPRGARRGYYELVIECESPLPPADRLAAAFEDALCRVNICYLDSRINALDHPRVTYLPHGWFSGFRGRLLETRNMQAKEPVFWTAKRPEDWPPIE